MVSSTKQITSILLLGCLASVYGNRERCSRPEDCPDAGTTCDRMMGACRCWTEHSALAADAWSCNDDATCARSFPGHVCRLSTDCQRTKGRMGYCTPIGAIRTTTVATSAPAIVTAAPVIVTAAPVVIAAAPVAVKQALATTAGTLAPPASTQASTAAASTAAASSGSGSVGGGYTG